MTKSKSKNTVTEKETKTVSENTLQEDTGSRSRPKRRKTYERVREAEIPQYVRDLFRQDDYELKLIRWALNGEEDYRYLARRENEGYEFVSKDELPAEFLSSIREMDTRSRKGLVTMGDLCLMKVDVDLQKSRQDYFANVADQEVEAVNIHNITKKGLRDVGTKSKVMYREPSFD